MKPITYADYATEMHLWDHTVELVWHCGKCLTIKPSKDALCPYCHTPRKETAHDDIAQFI
jgi:hypothetical protein